jgi:hypothetical protein
VWTRPLRSSSDEAGVADSVLSLTAIILLLRPLDVWWAFCGTTYALAPVAGFGWLLATMGLAQCHARQRVLRNAYVGVFVLILLYSEIPWTGVLAEWTGR